MDKNILYNVMLTPDGTLLRSYSRHDYKSHVDQVSGETYFIDGGLDYIRASVNIVPARHIVYYDNDPHPVIRNHFAWGTYGPQGDQPLKWVLLKDLDTDHIQKILDLNLRPYIRKVFDSELDYRTEYHLD